MLLLPKCMQVGMCNKLFRQVDAGAGLAMATHMTQYVEVRTCASLQVSSPYAAPPQSHHCSTLAALPQTIVCWVLSAGEHVLLV